MVAFHFNLIAFSCACWCVGGYLISDLSDYRDYDASCIGDYIQKRYGLNISLKAKTKRLSYCTPYIESVDESFYETVGALIPSESRRECVINLLKRHRVSDVFFKAIGYNYFKRQLVKFSSNETCEGIVNVLRVDNDCEFREMTVNFIGGNKSLGKLRACLDDLFSEFNVDEIVFVDHEDSRIGRRRFGGHLTEFFRQINETGKTFCSESNVDLAVKYFAADNAKEAGEKYNETQIECFKNFHFNNKIIKRLSYRHSDTLNRQEDSTACENIMQEEVLNVISIDLFGFTGFSQRVKNCIIDRNRSEQLIEQVIILPTVVKHLDSPSGAYIKSTKRIIEMSLDCLQFF